MKAKKFLVYSFFVCIFSTMLFFLFYNNMLKMNSSLGAAITPIKEDDTVIINAAKLMVSENIDKYKGENIITVKDLITENYLTGYEINPMTNEPYDLDIRVVVYVEDNVVNDVYIKNVLFSNVFSCNDICYLNDKNYIAFNNDIYQIIKIDSTGSIYITNNQKRVVFKDQIENKLKNIMYSLDKNLVTNVITLTKTDIDSSNIINGEEDLFINTSLGYKLYNSITGNIDDIENIKSSLIPVVVIKNNITYESGDGTKFRPFIINE